MLIQMLFFETLSLIILYSERAALIRLRYVQPEPDRNSVMAGHTLCMAARSYASVSSGHTTPCPIGSRNVAAAKDDAACGAGGVALPSKFILQMALPRW